MNKAAFIFSDKLAQFEYGDDHPFKPIRARNTMELCNRYGLLYAIGVSRLEPDPQHLGKLSLFHGEPYLDVLKKASAGEFDLSMLTHGIGTDDCPPLPQVYDFSDLAVSATLTGVDLILKGEAERAFNLVGGLHHGGRDHAEGFCYVNDVGVAIEYLKKLGKRIAFVDIDAHHCNGVQDAFYDDDQTLLISLHESGDTLYPNSGYETEIGTGKGKGYTVNVPLAEKTDDAIYVNTFKKIVPPLIKAFNPDIVIAEVGADTVISDPLTHLRLTTNGYYEVMQELCACTPNLVCVGGGGYDIYRTSRCWTLAWAAMSELEPEDDFAGAVGGMMYGSDMDSLFDRPMPTKGDDKIKAEAQAAKVVEYIRKNIFPILGAK